jgi:hypothetical protein
VFDQPTLFRTGAEASLKITADGVEGLVVGETNSRLRLGTPGEVVDAGETGILASERSEGGGIAWLESSGNVFSMRLELPDVRAVAARFSGKTVLALATSLYTTLICAVLADGSVECANASDYVGVPDLPEFKSVRSGPGSAIGSCTPL